MFTYNHTLHTNFMRTFFTCMLLCVAVSAFAQDTITLIDKPNKHNAIKLGGETFKIAWGDHNEKYYKQEYLRSKDKLEEFNKMIIIDVLITESSLYDAVNHKIGELEERKKTDPVVNYQVAENEELGEYMIDFLMSAGGIYEWNCYRYRTINTTKGQAIMVFGYAQRTYSGAEIDLDEFFEKLAENRNKWMQMLADFTIPPVTLKD